MQFSFTPTAILFLLVLTISCHREEPVIGAFKLPLHDRAAYEKWLKEVPEHSSKVLAVWDSISDWGFRDSLFVETPFFQKGFFLPNRKEILSFRMMMRRGEKVVIELTKDSSDNQIFMDFFKVRKRSFEKLWKSSNQTLSLTYEVPENGQYLLRVQPELFKTIPYELKIKKSPVYSFPVAGKGNEDIWSFWGDPRGGGKRKHKGIDIFARRGTPLIAITKAYVANVSDRGLGGKQIWLRDRLRRQSLYYAHLNEQFVREGQWVEAGDTIGTVGNTGNARSTRPHLHFGIYRRGFGAFDPLPAVFKTSKRNKKILGEIDATLQKGVILQEANLRVKPTRRSPIFYVLNKNKVLEILGANDNYYHVRLENGQTGFVHYSSVKPFEEEV